VVEEWTRFEVTRHEVDVRYQGRWYCITFCGYPNGDFGDGWIWQIGSDGARLEPPAKLSAHQIGSIVDGAGADFSSPPAETE
jgi:hypothetical protein